MTGTPIRLQAAKLVGKAHSTLHYNRLLLRQLCVCQGQILKLLESYNSLMNGFLCARNELINKEPSCINNSCSAVHATVEVSVGTPYDVRKTMRVLASGYRA